jgi:hypothetical protein
MVMVANVPPLWSASGLQFLLPGLIPLARGLKNQLSALSLQLSVSSCVSSLSLWNPMQQAPARKN